MRLTVVIPTFNRPDALKACLASIAPQQVPELGDIDVLVVNDGGDPSAAAVCREFYDSSDFPFALRYMARAHGGPSAVRNAAARESDADILLYLNDDVTLGPGHLAAHLALHEAAEKDADAPRRSGIPLVLGKGITQWAEDSVQTPLMQWLSRQSFHYYLIDDPADIGYEFYHTSDLSVRREAVIDLAPFDEAFKRAGFEDTEWGCRLERMGARLVLLAGAVTEHHHVYDETALARRSYWNGRLAALLFEREPWLRHRAIDDFILPEEIPLHQLDKWLNPLTSPLARLFGGGEKGRRRMNGKIRGLIWRLGTIFMSEERRQRAALSAWSARVISQPRIETLPIPARWVELSRREHVRGFLETHTKYSLFLR